MILQGGNQEWSDPSSDEQLAARIADSSRPLLSLKKNNDCLQSKKQKSAYCLITSVKKKKRKKRNLH